MEILDDFHVYTSRKKRKSVFIPFFYIIFVIFIFGNFIKLI